MKRHKSLLSIIMLLMIFGLNQACDNNDKKEETPTPTTPTPTPAPTPPESTIDLFPTNMKYYDYSIFEFTICNGGNSNAHNVRADVFTTGKYGEKYCNRFLLIVPANGCVTRTVYPARLMFPSSHGYLIIVDPNNTIAETNELNNRVCSGTYCTDPPSYSICPSEVKY